MPIVTKKPRSPLAFASFMTQMAQLNPKGFRDPRHGRRADAQLIRRPRRPNGLVPGYPTSVEKAAIAAGTSDPIKPALSTRGKRKREIKLQTLVAQLQEAQARDAYRRETDQPFAQVAPKGYSLAASPS